MQNQNLLSASTIIANYFTEPKIHNMNKNKKIEICLVEDHHEIRNGIVFIINTFDEFSCRAFKTAEEALNNIEIFPPDVVLMDINLPGMNGIECTRRIKEKHPQVLIMMCTVFEDTEKIFDALKAGASGYILKRTAGEKLIDAIKELLRGGAPMSSDIARKVVNSFQHIPRPETYKYELTNKEQEILDLLAKGHSNKEIADCLCVSTNTVRTHVYHIYEKLHVHNRVEALNKVKSPATK